MEPVSIDEVLTSITTGNEKVRAAAICTLCSVVHNEPVKVKLASNPAVLVAVANTLGFPTPVSHSVRWECLAVLGEACRRESSKDNLRAKHLNDIADALTTIVAGVEGLGSILTDLAKAEDDASADVREMAADVYNALPLDGATFSAEKRSKCKDLLYLDPSEGKVPRVARASNVMCNACSATPSTKLLRCSACKSAFYCSSDCQKSHWKTHKTLCKAQAAELHYPTRRDIFRARAEGMANVTFEDYFFQYCT
eukprot:PhM_4_TR4199/c0_g1_i2/m.82613